MFISAVSAAGRTGEDCADLPPRARSPAETSESRRRSRGTARRRAAVREASRAKTPKKMDVTPPGDELMRAERGENEKDANPSHRGVACCQGGHARSAAAAKPREPVVAGASRALVISSLRGEGESDPGHSGGENEGRKGGHESLLPSFFPLPWVRRAGAKARIVSHPRVLRPRGGSDLRRGKKADDDESTGRRSTLAGRRVEEIYARPRATPPQRRARTAREGRPRESLLPCTSRGKNQLDAFIPWRLLTCADTGRPRRKPRGCSGATRPWPRRVTPRGCVERPSSTS